MYHIEISNLRIIPKEAQVSGEWENSEIGNHKTWNNLKLIIADCYNFSGRM